MKDRSPWLSTTAITTIYLLCIAACLLVLGSFDANLDWDIFSPSVEKFLMALFLSCLAVAAIGVAICFVIAAHEIVRNVRLIQTSLLKELSPDRPADDSSARKTTRWLGVFLVVVAVLVGGLALINQRVQQHRYSVFRRLATEQFEAFAPKIAMQVAKLSEPPRNTVPTLIHDYIQSLDSIPFVQRTTLYLPDPADTHAMWGYTAWREWNKEDGFGHFFIAKPFEKAMSAATTGNVSALDSLNQEDKFEWYGPLKDSNGRVVGILRIDGKPTENFRDY